jgi:hypothetical protein
MSSALADHVWEQSVTVDRVWAQVLGKRFAAAERTPLMVIQAHVDESVSGENVGERFFVMAGHIATAQQWAAFIPDWESFLDWATVGPNGERRFKLYEMGLGDDAKLRILAFYRVIEAHAPVSISVQFRLADLERAKARIMVPGVRIDWGIVGDPYAVAFKAILQGFHHNRAGFSEVIPGGEPVEFIFDDISQKKPILEAWDGFLATSTEAFRNSLGGIRFDKEERLLPLQAADLYAGLVRRANEGWPQPFAGQVAKQDMLIIDIVLTEDEMTKNFILGIEHDLPDREIIDLGAR